MKDFASLQHSQERNQVRFFLRRQRQAKTGFVEMHDVQTFCNGSESTSTLIPSVTTRALRTSSIASDSIKRLQILLDLGNTLKLLLVRNYFNHEVPLAWTIKLAKEDSLPAAQRQPSFFHEHHLAAADKHCFNM